ncbi:peroxiredoxin family protein [Pedobacter miscanthi]|uniref:TlpA family protein disulfide reductase n=1 Tax=Pedobacter miscanthi TaxID=2259170 RepID=A0A366KWN8_9SPHI|nr:TlpA disulfide reductase family protein [Pedobacter miscanthi]RBQ05504.1 TlpA family protein disulfide reductase [Pedobacter miscanthi]
MKLKLSTFLLTFALTGSVFAQQSDPDVESPAIKKQKEELEATLASVNQKLALSEKTYRDAQTKKVKYDTLGLGAWRAEMARFKEEKNGLTLAFIKQHPDYFTSLLALKDVIGALPKDVQSLEKTFAKLDKNIQQTATGVKTKAVLDKFDAVSIGRIAPGFSAPDTAGKSINLSDFRGKYVLLDFWASWCGPCREENPIVVKAYNTYKDRNFEILSVSLDQPGKQEAWLKAIHDDQLNWKHVSDLKFWKNDVAQLYSVMSIPQNFLIDPNGKIIAANLRGAELAKKLATLLPQTNQGK